MCEVACSSRHFGAVSPSLSRIRVAKLEEVGIELAVVCVSCLEKPCLACPNQALAVGGSGQILLDDGKCDACMECVAACPIGAAGFHEGRPLFCGLCDGTPSCVAVCPTSALSFREDFRDVRLDGFVWPGSHPAQRRARYARFHGEPLRAAWQNGARIDS